MARIPADHPPAAAIRALADADHRLALRVTPGAKTESITIADGRVQVKVRVPPEDGKATAAVIALLARALDVAPGRIELLRGATAREKLVRIPPAAPAQKAP